MRVASGGRWLRRLVVALVVLASPASEAAEIEVSSLDVFLRGGTWFLDTVIDYEFTDTVLDALVNGVPITLDVQVKVQRELDWPWEKLWAEKLVNRHLRYQIRYHALASLYQVKNLDSGTEVNFATREAAVRTLGEVFELPLLDNDRLEPGKKYEVRVRASLDIEALPLPLRPLAYISPAWNLSSPWETWPLTP
jgi:hypothetical protein